jgi:hypothetical protein
MMKVSIIGLGLRHKGIQRKGNDWVLLHHGVGWIARHLLYQLENPSIEL